jgi:hypothetical protein
VVSLTRGRTFHETILYEEGKREDLKACCEIADIFATIELIFQRVFFLEMSHLEILFTACTESSADLAFQVASDTFLELDHPEHLA